ncbi:proline-rich receptor-like protein kinase PERK2 [Iris pallida]|uniref:Proline-rich receptor-like protein kinase PERK2 n=1 Tax=Iris pallida TaxID=29817 RepID=A0AAX6IAT6_IRIPA|nr:proline-rich receptor-like protein kinase PERK2 [Iris pallida]
MGLRVGGGSAGTGGKTGSAPRQLRTSPVAGRRCTEVTRSWVQLLCIADLVQAVACPRRSLTMKGWRVGRDLEAGHNRGEAGLARSPSWRRPLSVSSRRGRDK